VLENLDGQDVPDFQGDDVGYQDVDIFRGVDDFALAVDTVDWLDVVAAGAQDFSAFQLNAPEARAEVEDEIIALTVSPRLGDAEAKGSSFEHEGGFGDFSGALGVADKGGSGCDSCFHMFGCLSGWEKEKAQLWAAPLKIFIDIE